MMPWEWNVASPTRSQQACRLRAALAQLDPLFLVHWSSPRPLGCLLVWAGGRRSQGQDRLLAFASPKPGIVMWVFFFLFKLKKKDNCL